MVGADTSVVMTSVVEGPGTGVGDTCVGGRVQVKLVWVVGPGAGVGDTCVGGRVQVRLVWVVGPE